MKPPSNYLTLNSCHREKILEFLHSDHLENEKLPDNPCTELTKLNISRQTAVLKTTRVLPCSNHNPACEDSMVEICKMYDKFLSESGKKWSWVVFDGGPMISFLKLQRTCPNEYNKLHPIVGALHEDVLSWYYLHSSGLSWSLGTCVHTKWHSNQANPGSHEDGGRVYDSCQPSCGRTHLPLFPYLRSASSSSPPSLVFLSHFCGPFKEYADETGRGM